MNSKVQSKRNKKKGSQQVNKTQWVILSVIYGIVLMYLYGMSSIYFPTPVHIGFGQYLDPGIGILFFGLMFYGVILGILIKKK